MKVGQAMTRGVRVAYPQQTIREAARAAGKRPETPVVEVMTREVRYCFEDEDLEEVVKTMEALGLRRLPVLDRNKRLVGILFHYQA